MEEKVLYLCLLQFVNLVKIGICIIKRIKCIYCLHVHPLKYLQRFEARNSKNLSKQGNKIEITTIRNDCFTKTIYQ